MVRLRWLAVLLALLWAHAALATTWYVNSSTGNNSNNGTSAGTPFLNFAPVEIGGAHPTQPGDTVIVAAGTYTSFIGNLSPGSAGGGYVTFECDTPNYVCLIQRNTTNAVAIDANYVQWGAVIGGQPYGFDITTKVAGVLANWSCVFNNNASNHHIIVQGNRAHDCGGQGIGTSSADYVQILDNVVYNTSTLATNQTSGISIFSPKVADTLPGFHNVIARNLSYSNFDCVAPTSGCPSVTTDGEGIILDTFTANGYQAWTLVENNITFNNGSGGIEVFSSGNVLIRNNVSWGNNQDVNRCNAVSGELYANQTYSVYFMNNVVQVTTPILRCAGTVQQGSGLVEVDTSSKVPFALNQWDWNDAYFTAGDVGATATATQGARTGFAFGAHNVTTSPNLANPQRSTTAVSLATAASWFAPVAPSAALNLAAMPFLATLDVLGATRPRARNGCGASNSCAGDAGAVTVSP